MNLSNPQDDLSEAKLSQPTPVQLEELQYHFEGLRSLFIYVLVALIATTLTVDLCFIRRQMLAARNQVEDQRPRVREKVGGYNKQIEPRVRDFVGSLQSFAASNHDFQPILDRYRPFLLPYMGPASSPAQSGPPKGPPTLPK